MSPEQEQTVLVGHTAFRNRSRGSRRNRVISPCTLRFHPEPTRPRTGREASRFVWNTPVDTFPAVQTGLASEVLLRKRGPREKEQENESISG